MTPTPEARRSDDDARFGAARDGVCVLAPDWRIRYMNASMLEILRLLGREGGIETLWDALPAWEHTPEADRLREAMTSPTPRSFRIDGERGRGRVWEVSTEPLPAGDLRVRLRNVTAQVQAERAEAAHHAAGRSLAEREARLDAVVEGAPVGIVVMDAGTFTVREANDFYHQFLEGKWRRPGAIVGHTPREFLPTFEESGTADIFRRVRDTGEPFEIAEFPFSGFERGTTYFRWTLKALGEGGEPRYLLLLVAEITEQVVARQQVEAERKALYDVLGGLPVGVLVAEAPSGRTVYLNAAGAALGGRTPEELSAGTVGEYTGRWAITRPTGEPFPAEELPLARALRGEPTRDEELVLHLPGGAERTVLASGVPLRDAGGGVDRAMVAFYDITERLALERALLERTREAEGAASEAAMRADESRALREIGRALVSELEPDRVLHLTARAAMELLGARGSGIAAPLADGSAFRIRPALGSLEPLDGSVFPLAGSVVEAAMAERRAFAFNRPEDVPDSSAVVPHARVLGTRNLLFVPLIAFGETLGVLAAVDREGDFAPEHTRLLESLADQAALAIHNARLYTAERRRADESRALLAAAEALTATLDPQEVMERIARTAAELTGADGAGLTMLAGEAHDRTMVAAATGVLAPLRGTGGPSRGSLTEGVVREGRPARVAVSALPEGTPAKGVLEGLGVEHYALVPMRSGEEAVGALGVVRGPHRPAFDDADLRLLALLGDQAALAVRNARLYEASQAASRAKTDFLAMMSHELRTPLNALEGYASLLEDGIYGAVTEQQARALSRMRVARRHLMALIDQVLDLARVEARRKEAEVVETDLGELLRGVGEALRGAAEAKGLALEVEVGALGRGRTDPGLLRQVVTNLLGNAFKFTEEGRVALRALREGGGIVVEVSDTGPGIASEHRERIFEPFYQVDPSITRKEGGSGLGLALSREFARLLGGDLSVRGAPGEGSTFVLTLPV